MNVLRSVRNNKVAYGWLLLKFKVKKGSHTKEPVANKHGELSTMN